MPGHALVASITVITVTLPDGTPLAAWRTAPRATTPRPRSAPGWRRRPWPSRSTARSATSPARCPTAPTIAIVTPKSGDDYLYVLRHTAAHVLAEAVQDLFPGTRFGFGPPIEDGFYYDFELPRATLRGGLPGDRSGDAQGDQAARRHWSGRCSSIDDAREFFAARGQGYKVDQVDFLAAAASPPCRCTSRTTSSTCARDPTCTTPVASARSSCCRSPAPTGAGRARTRC